MDVSNRAARVPAAMIDAAFIQRHVFAGELLAGRRVMLAGDRTGAGAELLHEHGSADRVTSLELPALFDAVTADDAIVCLDDLDDPALLDPLVDALVRKRADGAAVVVSVPGAEGFSTEATASMTYEQALATVARLPGGVLLLQSAAEASLLHPADLVLKGTIEAELVALDRLAPEHVEHYVIAAGLDDAITRAGGRATLRTAVAPVATQTIRQLETANAELVRVNARLGRAQRGHGGAAAVAALTRLRTAQEHAECALAEAQAETAASARRLVELNARALAAEQRVEALTERAMSAESQHVAVEQRAQAAERRVAEVDARAIVAEQRVVEVEQRAIAAEQRSAAAEQRALDAERRARQLETELSRMRGSRTRRAAQRVSRLLRR